MPWILGAFQNPINQVDVLFLYVVKCHILHKQASITSFSSLSFVAGGLKFGTQTPHIDAKRGCAGFTRPSRQPFYEFDDEFL